ncbi:hypothetical protein GCM10010182_80190 [Actinomadura cremea]|nr:hypothetical protein GCM10010182_80190 [Actinomadura cremea]
MTDPDPQTTQLAQINTKLDVLISQHGNTARRVEDHEARIRDGEGRQAISETRVADLTARDRDQEERLRKTDRWRYAMPIAGVGAGGALLTGAAALVTSLNP